MKSFSVSIDIAASASDVWPLLCDVQRWSSWNTTIASVDDEVALGSTVSVYPAASPGRAFPVKVAKLDSPHMMVWRGGMPFGLFEGTRTFELLTREDGKTVFSMKESFTGLLAPLIVKSIPDLQPAFDEFAACLKRAAEHK